MENGSYRNAFNLINPYAQKGWACAQLHLNILYQNGGPDFPKNYQLAKYWGELAASEGNVNALGNLGLLHYYGLGTPVNKEKGVAFLKKAARLGNKFSIKTLKELGYQSIEP